MVAHHPYDQIIAFVIAFVGILLIIWAERRAKARHRSHPQDRLTEPAGVQVGSRVESGE